MEKRGWNVFLKNNLFSLFLVIGLIVLTAVIAGDVVVKDGSLIVNTSNLFVDSSTGNVGVGTASPTSKLDVRGTSHTYTSIGSTGAANLDRGLKFLNGSGFAFGYITFVPNTVGTDSKMFTYVGGGTSADVKMVIDDNGRVGIGTQNPQSTLHVDGSGTTYVQIIKQTVSQGSGLRLGNATTNKWLIGMEAQDDFVIKDDDASDVTRFIINETNGYIGIGTGTPNSVLHVNNTLKLTPTDSPPTCSATLEGTMYYDDSLNEMCFCNAVSWGQFDGGGSC